MLLHPPLLPSQTSPVLPLTLAFLLQIFHEVRGIADDSEKKEERIAMKPVETATATEKPMLEAEQETSVTAEEEDGAAQG